MNTDPIYNFAFRGLLTINALEKTSCTKKQRFTEEEGLGLVESLGINELDEELVKTARKMAIVYTGICAFENTVRKFISNVLIEAHGENWWMSKVSDKIRSKAENRRDEENKILDEHISTISESTAALIIAGKMPPEHESLS